METVRHEPEHRAYRHLVMCLNVLIASRNYNQKMRDNNVALIQRIGAANDAIAALRRAQHILLSTPQMKQDLQFELDLEE